MARGVRAGRGGASDLKRRGPQREPKRRFVLFCEGAKTEPAYFAAIRRACSGAMIAVEIVRGPGAPMTVAEEATQEAKSRKRGRRGTDSFEEGDRIWAVFDRDAHPRFDDAVTLCERHGVKVGRSDPCFELWLILHQGDYNKPCSSQDAQRKLAQLRPEYDKDGTKTPNCGELAGHVEEAEERAEAQLQRREEEGAPYGNPSTTVGRLTRAIREAAERASPPATG